MRKKSIIILALGLFISSCATLNSVVGGMTGGALTTEEIGRGLKEALTVGINNSSTKASALDGYLGNSLIKLLFPPEAQKVEAKLRQIGLGGECDKFITALNRGAEDAARSAAPIFIDAITKMTIQDALSILKGDKDAATQYLKKTSTTALVNAFGPVIESSLNKTNATKAYSDIANLYNRIPLVQKVNPDLKGYATNKAIDGLFLLVAQEEANIRENPMARVSDLLKRVFGS